MNNSPFDSAIGMQTIRIIGVKKKTSTPAKKIIIPAIKRITKGDIRTTRRIMPANKRIGINTIPTITSAIITIKSAQGASITQAVKIKTVWIMYGVLSLSTYAPQL
jgi:hypothetical protein